MVRDPPPRPACSFAPPSVCPPAHPSIRSSVPQPHFSLLVVCGIRSNLEFLLCFICFYSFTFFVLLLISCLFRSHQDVHLFRLVWKKEVERQSNPTGAIRCVSYLLGGRVGLDEAPCGLHFVLDPKPISQNPIPNLHPNPKPISQTQFQS